MKKLLILVLSFVFVGGFSVAHAYEPDFLQSVQDARTGLSASATSFSAAAQRANPAANVVYPNATQHVAGAAITKTLKYGMKNDPQVVTLQIYLIAKGYLIGTADGSFGPKTLAAVKKFQAANGIPQLGIVGPRTRALIL